MDFGHGKNQDDIHGFLLGNTGKSCFLDLSEIAEKGFQTLAGAMCGLAESMWYPEIPDPCMETSQALCCSPGLCPVMKLTWRFCAGTLGILKERRDTFCPQESVALGD